MIQLHCNNRTFLLPEQYNELTGDQLIAVKNMMSKPMDATALRLQLLRILLNETEKTFFKWPADWIYNMLYYHQPEVDPFTNEPVSASVDWLLKEQGLTQQLLPEINGLYGPKSEFDNLRMKEFHVAELRYMDYMETKEEQPLNDLVAVLYRPAKIGYDFTMDSDGDARVPFNPNELPYWSSVVSRWPMATKIAVLQFYDNCRAWMEELYDAAFSGSGGSNDSQEPDGMFGLMRSLAGERWGTFSQVEDLLVHIVFKELEASLAEAKTLQP